MALKLLLVDDEPEVLKAVKDVLQSLGYEVLALADSREAQRRVEREKFNGIFMDARMPNVDGFQLARQIRNTPSNSGVPIVMLTGFDDVETMRAGFRAGVTFFLPKPLEVAKVSSLLRVMHDAMLREKRSYVRLPLRTVVTCRLASHEFRAASLNISEGGMMLDCTGGAEVGQEIELRFSLPGVPSLLNPTCTVVRKESADRMAVKFSRPDPEEVKAIQGYIAGVVKS